MTLWEPFIGERVFIEVDRGRGGIDFVIGRLGSCADGFLFLSSACYAYRGRSGLIGYGLRDVTHTRAVPGGALVVGVAHVITIERWVWPIPEQAAA